MKKLLMKINDEREFAYPVDGYVLGIQNYSYGFEKRYSLNEVKGLRQKYPDKELFVSFNRLIFNEELDDYKKVLVQLDGLGLEGVIVGDVAALTYGLKTPLIIDQAHLNNSVLTINYYHDNGAFGVVLTNDITLHEINSVRANTKAVLFKQVFGLVHLSSSARKLVSNYLDYFNLSSDSKTFFIAEENSDDYYRVVEDKHGSHIYNSKVLNLLNANDEIDTDYAIIDSYLLDKEVVGKVVLAFKNGKHDAASWINQEFNADDGFINKKTIYRVKNNE